MQYITNREIIDRNREAIANGTLGAIKHEECLYIYEDGCRCAIGVCLNSEVVQFIENNPHLNGDPVISLTDLQMVAFENEKIARITQNLHDAWAERSTFGFPRYLRIADRCVNNFLDGLHGKNVGEAEFTQWLDVLDEVVP